jgi:hypothetical protein
VDSRGPFPFPADRDDGSGMNDVVMGEANLVAGSPEETYAGGSLDVEKETLDTVFHLTRFLSWFSCFVLVLWQSLQIA